MEVEEPEIVVAAAEIREMTVERFIIDATLKSKGKVKTGIA